MKISSEFVVKKIGGSFYAVPLSKNPAIGNGMIKLNETAHFMWQKISEGLNIEEIADIVCTEYAVDRETAINDIRAFAEQLRKVGVLEG